MVVQAYMSRSGVFTLVEVRDEVEGVIEFGGEHVGSLRQAVGVDGGNRWTQRDCTAKNSKRNR